MFNITGVALVTGASRGIGRAIALTLAKQGATVIGTATSEAGADAISKVISEVGGQGQGIVLDVTVPEQIQTVMDQITEQYSAPSILVNNAGITRDNLMLRMKDEEWQAIIDTNLTSVFRVSKACLKGMLKARYGRIISIASVVAASGNAGQANYAAAKAGIIGFSKSLGQEIASRNITVNVVAPGFIDTDMTKEMTDLQKETLLQSIPMNRMGAPEDIAAVVAFLAAKESGYITGETIHVNGGMYMS